jgi:hypothetical protein
VPRQAENPPPLIPEFGGILKMLEAARKKSVGFAGKIAILPPQTA